MFVILFILGLLVLAGAASTDQEYNSKGYSNLEYKSTGAGIDDSQVYVYPAGFKGGRYYYGGVYRGKPHHKALMKHATVT